MSGCGLWSYVTGRSYRSLPTDELQRTVRYFPEIDTYKLAFKSWRAAVTGYDYGVDKGHACGGTMTLLWHERAGVVLLSSVVDYYMAEALNMQLPLKKNRHRTLTPRLEKMINGKRFATCYDTNAEIAVKESENGIRIYVSADLVCIEQEQLPDPVSCKAEYRLSEDGLHIGMQIDGPCEDVRLVLPVISDEAKVTASSVPAEPERIFYLAGGFGAREFIVYPDEKTCLWVDINLVYEEK